MKKVTLKFDSGCCIDATIIVSDKDKSEGFRKFPNLEGNQGLLFVYNEPKQQTFWNKGVYHKVALLSISKELVVENINILEEDSTSLVIALNPYKYYLEVKPQVITELGIKSNSRIIDILD